jgi:phosphoglycerate kinase
MFKLPKLENLDISGKKVLVRLDLDTEPNPNDLRIKSSFPTLDYLKSKNAEIIIIAHRGRPEGKVEESLSLAPFQKIFGKWGAEVEENLRFNLGEEANDEKFAAELASKADVYVNEAFGASHREHASLVELPKLLPHAVGLRFEKEVENLSKLLESPPKPFITLLSGVKKDKLDYLEGLKALSDKVLIGGRLPDYLGDNTVSVRSYDSKEKVIIGNLSMDKEDLTLNTIERFEEEVSRAKTILVSGPLGKFEEEGHLQATQRVLNKIAETPAFKVVGGGDTLAAIELLNLEDKFNWLSVGGGAMLEFLIKRTLPGIEALLDR